MSCVLRMSTTSQKSQRLLKQLGNFCLDKTIHGGQLKRSIYEVFCQYVCHHIFSPSSILEYMDMHGGVLNYEGIEALHAINMRGIPNKPSLLPSTTMLQKLASVVENYGVTVCPNTIHSSPDGSESFFFQASDILMCAMTAAKCFAKADR